ncbi:hypothetical protein ES705_49023 [subsurface metagenome]
MAIRKGAVRTQFLGAELTGEFANLATGVLDEWAVQDEITILGVELSLTSDAYAEAFALASQTKATIELSRAAIMKRDGAIATLALETRWATTAVHMGLDMSKQVVVMLPSGRGIDVDPGEVINLLYEFQVDVTEVATLDAMAIVYYIER